MTTTISLDRFDGLLLRPGDSGYDDARTVWNAMVDRRPRLIARCATVADVSRAVRAARDLDLEIGVKCGGHGILGPAVPDDGLMIDLTPMGEVRVDPERRRAWVQGGALLGALDREAQRHGLATMAGNVSHTGVGGLTLGGGMGWLARQYGLSCDNVVSYQVVTADGETVRASRTENPELFWALRGGGGNFGIVTEFEFQLHDVGTRSLSVEHVFPLDGAEPAVRRWCELNAEAPRQATYAATAGADAVVALGFVWIGDPDEGRRHASVLRALGRPLEERVEELSYVDLQRREDTVEMHALRRYFKGHFLKQLSDGAVEAFLYRGSTGGEPPAARVSLQAYGGAIADVPDEDSAFGHRDTLFEFVTAASWADPADDEARMAATRRAAAAMAPWADGVYVNILGDDGQDGVERAYPPAKLARLTSLKTDMDPHNVFHLNQNIRPRTVS
ncbi:MAG: FAD-binding protein [Streptosporangiales bacterium]|nr:FAD-binding protein [Streptosporangiales bacterium]